MTENEILTRLQDILRDVLHQPALVVTREASAKNIAGWDSLAHVDILWNVEHEFSVKFALGEIQDLQNVGGLADLLIQKLAARR
ncbi:MAG: phosphopantetheine-binding protein [Terriglobia bacterium]